MRLAILAWGLLLTLGGAAWADSVALIYGHRGMDGDVAEPLRDAGFQVIAPRNRRATDMQAAATELQQILADGPADRLVIFVTGPLATDGEDTWVVADNAGPISRFEVGAYGVSLKALTDMAKQSADFSVIMIAPGREIPMGFGLEPGLEAGFGGMDDAGGLTYAVGPAARLAQLLNDMLTTPGMTLADAARRAPATVTLSGDLSETLGLNGEAAGLPRAALIEEGYWRAVTQIDTQAAFEAYLAAYPDGVNTAAARARITELETEPRRRAEAAENALNLSREARRDIQRNLALLGFDPRGIDGLFGPGSRAAVTGWQRENGFEETGFITGNQLLRLREQANARAAELEREAEERRRQEERRDRAYWRELNRGQDEASLRAYLARFPDGLFADIATARLGEIEDARRAEAAREEREAWDAAREADTQAAYGQFLNAYPNGSFAGAAQARLQELRDNDTNEAVLAKARADERRYVGTNVVRLLVEQRLAQLGLKPGEVDGKFDKATRKAIRRFQRERKLAATGFVSQQTMVRLMAGR